ncbi:hypothetical protein ACJRO7_020699 [Eucalyptus globulus]|uniref:RNase H type-1 domain-containing protein n=1 Tax=Eucalyptus globulus TaxID=34317 RepID=A0ABD3KP35_EUCGL
MKLNVDASYLSPTDEALVAGVCRDSTGHLIDGFASSIRASSALQAEAIALNSALKFLLQRGLETDRIIVESDSLVCVEAICDPEKRPWELRPILDETLTMKLRCPNLQIIHCHRGANALADCLVKAHRASLLPPNWASHLPIFLQDLVLSELPVNSLICA